MLNEQWAELLQRAEQYKINISIKTLSDYETLKIVGEMDVHDKNKDANDTIRFSKFVSMIDLQSSTIDIVEYEINCIIRELIERRDKILNGEYGFY